MSLVRLDLTERVAWITLESPLHVINEPMLEELDAALESLSRNREAMVTVVSGSGEGAFSNGIVMKDQTLQSLEAVRKRFHGVLRKMSRLPQATVAAIDGTAIGAGLELALVCDLVVASAASSFSLPNIKRACIPPAAIAILPAVCGRPAASDLILTGASFDAERALQLGVVSRVLARYHFDEQLRTLVAGLVELSPSALRIATRTLRARWLAGFDSIVDALERTYVSEVLAQPDVAEAMRAAHEGRAPKWSD